MWVAELGVADALGEIALSVDGLAAATGTNSDALNRALRVLSAYGISKDKPGAMGIRRPLVYCGRITRSPCDRSCECKVSRRFGIFGSISTTN